MSSGTTVLTGNPSGNGVRVTCGLLEDTRLHKERTVDVTARVANYPPPTFVALLAPLCGLISYGHASSAHAWPVARHRRRCPPEPHRPKRKRRWQQPTAHLPPNAPMATWQQPTARLPPSRRRNFGVASHRPWWRPHVREASSCSVGARKPRKANKEVGAPPGWLGPADPAYACG